jgi:hypothetical protein
VYLYHVLFVTINICGIDCKKSNNRNLSMVSIGRSPAAQVGRQLQRAMRALAAQSNQAIECGGSYPTGAESSAAVAAEEITRVLQPRSRR